MTAPSGNAVTSAPCHCSTTIGLGSLGLHDLKRTDLGLAARRDTAAHGLGQQLVAKANAEKGTLHLDDETADGGFLGLEPGILLLLPHVLRPAHHHHRIERFEVRNGLALVDLDRRPGESVFPEEVPEHTRMLDSQMLQDQNFHAPLSLTVAMFTQTFTGPGAAPCALRSRIGQ
jgi:hypothetical protein